MTDDAASLPLHRMQRLHPATLLLAVVRVGPRMVNFAPALIALGVTGRWTYIVPALLLFLAISILFAWLAWSRFQWQVGDAAIAIKSGVFSRNDRTLPFDRIQDVAIEQRLLQRLLGIATVRFETGSAAEKKDDGTLDSIGVDQAHALRTYIRDHRQPSAAAAVPAVDAAADGAPPVGQAVDRPIFAMSPARVVQAGLFNFSLAVVGVLFGILQTFDNVLPIKPFSFDFWREFARGTALEDWVLAHRWLAVASGLVTLIILGLVTGVVRSVLRDWNFRLSRAPRGLRRTRGLTTRTDVTLPLARVQAALLLTGPVRRWFGWYDLRLQSLANDGKNESDHSVAPFAQLTEVDTVLEEIQLDRLDFEEGAAKGNPHWRRSLPVTMFGIPLLLLLIGVAQYLVLNVVQPDLVWLCRFVFASAPFMLLLGWLDWRNRRWHFDGRLLHVTSGFLNRKHIILPARNVQSADLKIGPIMRRLDGASLHFGVPGGKAEQHRITSIAARDAAALRDAILAVR